MNKFVKYIKIILNLFVAAVTLFFIVFICPKIIVFFMPFVIGWLIALIANPLVRFLERRLKIVRKLSSMIIIIGVLAGVILFGYLVIAGIVNQVMNLVHNMPQYYESIESEFNEIGQNLQVIYDKLPLDMQVSITEFITNLTSYLGNLVQAIGVPTFTAAGNFAKNVPGTLISIIMTILSAYFFTAQHVQIVTALKKITSSGVQEKIVFVLNDLKHVVGGYFKAQLKIMVVVYIIVLIGLWILRVDLILLIGTLLAFLDFLPLFGTGTVLIPWAIIKVLSGDYALALGLGILYLVTQLVRQFIQPKILSDSIGLNPLVALFIMYIGYKISSIIGMIVAVPLGMILINLYKAGVFQNQIDCVKELVRDINEFRKM